MALIPGSYARAAGLQSEINKVTITRVAGSEVQFRRTIDTYQRDLRYHVNQIGREQKQLKRSMRKYYKKLHDSKKERKQREAKVKEDSERLKNNAESFRQAAEAVKRAPLVGSGPKATDSSTGIPDKGLDGTPDDAGNSQNVVIVDPVTPDSGICGDLDEKLAASPKDASHKTDTAEAEFEQQQHRKVFLTKTKVPYFRAKRGQKEKFQENEEQICIQENVNEEQSGEQDHAGEVDFSLPVIDEETEECGDQSKSNKTVWLSKQANGRQRVGDVSSLSDRTGKRSKLEPVSAQKISLNVASLDTKAAREACANDPGGSVAESDGQGFSDVGLPSLSMSVQLTGRRRSQRKAGVSYGDLIKLQHTHTSNTKRLFQLVDRLASKHGIVDLPAVSGSSDASSLDPRSNDKIKMRGDGPESQMSGGMVKQAAVLYSMKYGYQVSDDAFLGNTIPPLLLSRAISDDLESATELTGLFDVSQRDPADGRSTATSRKLSLLSVRNDSTDTVPPYYPPTEAMASILEDKLSKDVTLSLPPDGQDASHSGRSRNKQVPNMTELSEQASRIRERTLLAPDSRHAALDRSNSTPQPRSITPSADREALSGRKASPLPRRSRSLSRPRRDSVSNELQKRLALSGNSEGPNMAWHSAFGRLKLLHTLYDLSQHFTNNAS